MITITKGTLFYYKIHGKYGLLKRSQKVVKINSWTASFYSSIEPSEQELYFSYGLFNRKSGWAFSTDFECFSDSKRELKKYRKR